MSKHTKGEQVQIVQNSGPENLSVTRIEQVEYPISPLPSSAEFQGYENAVTGAGNRILTMFEKQVEHRIEIEKQFVTQQIESENEDIKNRSLGISLGVMTIWLLILLSIIFAIAGMKEASYTAIILPVASFAIYLLKYTILGKKS